MTRASQTTRLRRTDIVPIAILVVAGAELPLWLSAATGAIGLPTSDDWVYSTEAASLFRTGAIQMPQHTAASVGQLIMVQPLLWLSGGERWAFTAFGLVMAAIGTSSAYLLVRRFLVIGAALTARVPWPRARNLAVSGFCAVLLATVVVQRVAMPYYWWALTGYRPRGRPAQGSPIRPWPVFVGCPRTQLIWMRFSVSSRRTSDQMTRCTPFPI